MQENKKNNNNIIIIVVVAVLAAAGVIYFMNNNKSNGDNSSNSEESSKQETAKGNCTVLECMKKLNAKMTLEEVNEVIGFEGEKKSETDSYTVYNWDITEETGISVQFHTKYGTSTITADYPTSMAPNKADFSKWSEIKAKLNTKESLTYDEFVEMVGGVEGTIKKITDSDTSYQWYNSEGGYLSGYFNKDGKCKMATGRF